MGQDTSQSASRIRILGDLGGVAAPSIDAALLGLYLGSRAVEKTGAPAIRTNTWCWILGAWIFR
jgi:hypothetical protein